MNLDQFIAWLEPQAEPKRGGAMCMSTDDWTGMKTELEKVCRILGSRCKYQFREGLQRVDSLITRAQQYYWR